ncbi:hypothetical protein N9M78_00910 [Alphaproteobacteria bacterium]|nr:hypothetical protein [Alphaproteobacteria bacterium]
MANRTKKGFGVPISSWLKEFPKQIPLDPLPGIKTPSIAKAWREHRSGTKDHRIMLWTWMSLQYVINKG